MRSRPAVEPLSGRLLILAVVVRRRVGLRGWPRSGSSGLIAESAKQVANLLPRFGGVCRLDGERRWGRGRPAGQEDLVLGHGRSRHGCPRGLAVRRPPDIGEQPLIRRLARQSGEIHDLSAQKLEHARSSDPPVFTGGYLLEISARRARHLREIAAERRFATNSFVHARGRFKNLRKSRFAQAAQKGPNARRRAVARARRTGGTSQRVARRANAAGGPFSAAYGRRASTSGDGALSFRRAERSTAVTAYT
jgi:hypothetical protein